MIYTRMQWLVVLAALTMISSCSGIDTQADCDGEIVETISFDLRQFACWAQGEEGPLYMHGPFKIYLDDYLFVSGQYEQGRQTGVWYAFDADGQVVDICDYSSDAKCVLIE